MARTLLRWSQFSQVIFFDPEALVIRLAGHGSWFPSQDGRRRLYTSQVDQPQELLEMWRRQTGGEWGLPCLTPTGAYERLNLVCDA